MAKTDYKSIDEYHAVFSNEIQNRMQSIRNLVHIVAPDAEEVISYQIPAFKLGPKYHLIYYCAFPRHITISSPWSEAMLAKFANELKEFKVSKSAIQLPNNKSLPMDLIEQILLFRKSEFENKK